MMGGLSCHMSRQKSISVCGSGPACECVCMHGNGSGPVKPGLKYDAGAYEAVWSQSIHLEPCRL